MTRGNLSQRELDVVAGWWHEGTVKGAASLLGIAEQTAKNELRTARLRTGAPTTLALARMFMDQLPSVRTLRLRGRKSA
jgi:hypothetical protein